jgi:hypothetical protein
MAAKTLTLTDKQKPTELPNETRPAVNTATAAFYLNR